MREQTIYVADDGKKFDDKLECLKYENECLQDMLHNIKSLEDKLNKIKFIFYNDIIN